MTEPHGAGWDCHVHVFDETAPLRAGHYRPLARPLSQIEALAAAQGVAHLVLVQPSIYGNDNRVLLQALRGAPGRHRGVVVISGDEDEAALDALHAAGVRGARLNCVSPVGESGASGDSGGVEARFAQLAPRLRARGWHLQWYVAPARLPLVVRLHRGSGIVAVLDHLGGLHAGLAPADPAWAALHELADGGAWIKLSGWYRLQSLEPYADLQPVLSRALPLFAGRAVWGSDWPHTAFAADALPDYASTWQPVADALGAAAARALRQTVPAIYR